MLALSALALRRTLPLWLLLALLVLLGLAARGAELAPLVVLEVLDERARAGLRALERQNFWSVLFLAAPLFLWEAARLGRPEAGAWLAPTPAPRRTLGLALLAGCTLAALAATLVTALAGEVTTASAGQAWRRARGAESPAQLLFDDAPVVRWRIPWPAAGERLRLWVGVAAGAGPAVSARFSAGAGANVAHCEARVSGRTVLELVPPAGAGELELTLERLESGALLVLPPGALEVLEPVASERLAALGLGSRVWLALVAGMALALGLGRVLRPALTAALVLALYLVATGTPWLAELVPGADLAASWHELERGLVPAPAGARAWLGTFALAALGLALHACPAPRTGSGP